MKVCILNVANGGWYPIGQRRLKKSLEKFGFTGDYVFWSNGYPPGSPDHKETPYAFKTWAFKYARENGYDVALWLDSSMVAINRLDFIFDQIKEHGYWLPVENHRVGQWSTDESLRIMKMDRETSFSINTIMCGCMGLDFRNDAANSFLNQWHAAATDGGAFRGKHTNSDGSCSNDSRVMGHRHDIPAASIIAYRDNMFTYRWAGEIVPEYGHGTIYPHSVFICKRSCTHEEG